jgi:hypothetical protein
MAKDPDPGSVERAARLREQVDKLKNPDRPGTAPAKDQPAEPENPRDFIHRRMRELDKKDES